MKKIKKMVTPAIEREVRALFLKEHKVQLAKAIRAAALDKAIEKALRKHRPKLRRGAYIENMGGRGACVCAIGAALLTRASTTQEAKKLYDATDAFFKKSQDDARNAILDADERSAFSRKALTRWATKIVDEGITQEDLLQLEEGFEGGATFRSIALVEADEDSPFYKLGKKLAKRAVE